MKRFLSLAVAVLAAAQHAEAESYGRPTRSGMYMDPSSVQQPPDRAEDVIGTDAWAATTLENRFGYFTFAAGMVLEGQKAFRCTQTVAAKHSFAARKKCLADAGYGFSAQEVSKCTLSITEREPLRTNIPKTWDGQPSRPQIIGKETIIPLSLLRSDMIRRVANSFSLTFVNTPEMHVTQKILLANDPDKWIELPQPPEPDPDKQRYYPAWEKWSDNRKIFDDDVSVDIFGVEFFAGNEGSELTVHYNFPSAEEQGLVEPFIETVKAVIAKCVH